jgi:hypothetical protein
MIFRAATIFEAQPLPELFFRYYSAVTPLSWACNGVELHYCQETPYRKEARYGTRDA